MDVPSGPFSLRDFLQRILSGLLAGFLFIPYTATKINEEVFIGLLLLSYIAYLPIERSARIFAYIPKIKTLIQTAQEERTWHNRNWDYDKLFYSASNEDREYLYLTGAYAEFYRLSAFYFFLYFVVQLIALFAAPIKLLYDPPVVGAILSARTPILGEMKIPTLLAAVLSLILLISLLCEYLKTYRILFHTQYLEVARKYQAQDVDLVLSVWGTVRKKGEPVKNADVSLTKDGTILSKVKTGPDGRFQFINSFSFCKDGGCSLKAEGVELNIGKKQLPPFDLATQ